MTYVALNIFDTEMHPSVYKCGGSGGKEGLSLFGKKLYTLDKFYFSIIKEGMAESDGCSS